MKILTKNLLLIVFAIFGLLVGFLSIWWWYVADSLFFLNIPGMLLGEGIYTASINLLGNPISNQAHYTIPWLLRIPQVYILASILFWGFLGLIGRLFQSFINRKLSNR